MGKIKKSYKNRRESFDITTYCDNGSVVHVLVCTMIAVYIGREPKSPASSIGSNDTMDLDDYDTAEEKDREM